MARASSRFVCQSCGAVSIKWSGRCDACGDWNTLAEEPAEADGGRPLARSRTRARALDVVSLAGSCAPADRHLSGNPEFDRVCGGGLVPGSALLVGGDPGIGKSTLLLQIAARLSAQKTCLYVSGEEAVDQIRMRAARLGIGSAAVALASATSVRDILAAIDAPDGPDLVVVDSIQTMHVDTLESAPGTVSQVRAAAHELIRVAKRRGSVLIMVGHVTKDGSIAGPRVLEHMVDTVLYFEGDRGHQFRILRAIKNRFGATDEIGVFEMTDAGLCPVANPSALFLADRRGDVSGATVFAGMEGTRPVLVEIQALVAPSPLATPRRAVVGWDGNRLAMVLAVLEARCGVSIGANEIYLNVAGGLRIAEPAADTAVAAALLSSLSGIPMPEDAVIFGEVGLSGEVRAVSQMDARLKEAAKLGFARAYAPPRRGRAGGETGMTVIETGHISDVLSIYGDFADTPQARRARPAVAAAEMN